MYTDILIELVKSDLKTKYKNAFLGFLWIIFEPFFIMLILYLVFNRFIRFDMPDYPLYLLSGITAWRIFVNSTSSGLTSLYRNRDLILKVKIPRMLIPLSSVITALLTGICEILLYLIFYFIVRHTLHIEFLMIIPFLIIMLLLLTGIANILSVVYVFFRDVKPAWDILTQALFFLCPIFYPLSLIPIKYIGYYQLNPMALITMGFHKILYEHSVPNMTVILGAIFYALVFFLVSIIVFRYSERKMVKSV